jgi:hypothetical protein
MENDWAIVIGINKYPKVTGAPSLQGAVDDAKKFCDWLEDPVGGAVPTEHIGTFFQDNTSSVPTVPNESQLITFIENNLISMLPQRPFGRRFYLYCSGHGISPTGQESIRNAALLMANAIMPTPLFHVSGNILAEGMRSSAYFQEVVLIMDCCRDLKKNVLPHSFQFIDPVEDGKGCILVEAYATSWASKAREIALPPDDKVKGVFTYSLLEVLKAGRMTGTMLKISVMNHLARLLKDEKKSQEPIIVPDEELSKIVFNEAAETPRTPVTIHGLTLDQHPVIEFFPDGSDISQQIDLSEWVFNDADWQGFLEPRQYEIRLPSGGSRRLRIFAGVPEEVLL